MTDVPVEQLRRVQDLRRQAAEVLEAALADRQAHGGTPGNGRTIDACNEVLRELDGLQHRAVSLGIVVHFLAGGRAYCGKPGVPRDWEPHHLWESDWGVVNCPDCAVARSGLTQK